jgi:hypothetical protein
LEDERRIDGRVEERFEVAVVLRPAAKHAHLLQAARVGAEHEECRRGRDPRHCWRERPEVAPPVRILHVDHRRLLVVRLRRGGERNVEKQFQQRGIDGLVEVVPDDRAVEGG